MASKGSKRPQDSPRWTTICITIILTLGNLAISLHRSSRVYMLQQSLCLQHFLIVDPQKVNEYKEVDEKYCKVAEVQSPLSFLEGLDYFLHLLPGKSIHTGFRMGTQAVRAIEAQAIDHLLLSSATRPTCLSKVHAKNWFENMPRHQSFMPGMRRFLVCMVLYVTRGQNKSLLLNFFWRFHASTLDSNRNTFNILM